MEQHLGFVARLVFNPGLEEVKRLLGNNDFIHYVGHSVKGAQLEVAWKLRDGLLTGADIRALSQAGPLPYFVFASACPGLSGLEVPWDGQMYAAFLHGGTRHYLGTHWDLPDGQGAEFAVDYYHLMGSASLGAALRGARKGSVKKGDSLVFSLFFHCGEPDYSLSPASVAEEPTRLGVRGDVPWKKPRKNSESLPHGITPVRGGSKRGGRALRFLGAFLIILSVAIPSVYLTHKALKRRRDRIEVVLGRPLMDSTDRTLAFRGFSSTQKGLEGPIIRMERCFIKHLTYVSGLDVIDGREGMLPKGVYLELSGKIIPDKDGPRILLVVHRKRDRTILYIDEFSLFTAGEEQCIKLSEWVKRTLDL
ncbi:CHAT domain-containing protein [Myxococcota bacterium]|nr:CHAT domain-containing protein [Myxococcota bacterium]MBU1536223.1 CHAT domain-containing protein [Myxococcota bacterium]